MSLYSATESDGPPPLQRSLVRSPETPANRRIHWLDARIHQPATGGMLNPAKRELAKYKQITMG